MFHSFWLYAFYQSSMELHAETNEHITSKFRSQNFNRQIFNAIAYIVMIIMYVQCIHLCIYTRVRLIKWHKSTYYVQCVQSYTVVIYFYSWVTNYHNLIFVGCTRDMKHLCVIWTQCKSEWMWHQRDGKREKKKINWQNEKLICILNCTFSDEAREANISYDLETPKKKLLANFERKYDYATHRMKT